MKFVEHCTFCGKPFEIEWPEPIDQESPTMFFCKMCSKDMKALSSDLEKRRLQAEKDGFFYCEECGVKVNEVIDDNYLYCTDCAERLLHQLEHEQDEDESLR